MKRHPHFREDAYSPWHPAGNMKPARPGWYECVGWRFNGFLHLKWTGREWLYFGPKHTDPQFPQFGQHPTDAWRGITAEAVKRSTIRRAHLLDVAGQRFGLLTAIALEYTTAKCGAHWLCQCDCGSKRVLKLGWLTSGNTASCGCRQHAAKSVATKRPWSRP